MNTLDLKLHVNKVIEYEMHEKSTKLNYKGNWYHSFRQQIEKLYDKMRKQMKAVKSKCNKVYSLEHLAW